jgi:hypothetical protein
VTFGYLRTLYVRVCGINEPGHTCEEYMVLFAKLGMTLGDPYYNLEGNTDSKLYTIKTDVMLVDLLGVVHRL